MLLHSIKTPLDGGIIYTETNLSNFFPEPFNMVSSALFLAPALYWIVKLKGFSNNYIFLSIATYLLLTACIGSTVYHGLRRWSFFIYMDWVPIALLCLLASGYFWYKLLKKWYFGVIAVLAFVAVVAAVQVFLPIKNIQLAISLNYGIMVLMVVLPLALLIIRMKGHNLGLVLVSLSAFSVALFFRAADQWLWSGTGTHFLWHGFGCIATAAIFEFLYRLKNFKAEAADGNEK